MRATLQPTAMPAMAPALRDPEFDGVVVVVAIETLRVGVLVAGLAVRVIRPVRSGSSNPLVGAVLVAPPYWRPPHSRQDVGGHGVRGQVGLVLPPDVVVRVLFAEVHIEVGVQQPAAVVARIGAANDNHLRIVGHVAARHHLWVVPGDVIGGWVWASDPLEAGDSKDIDVIIVCRI